MSSSIDSRSTISIEDSENENEEDLNEEQKNQLRPFVKQYIEIDDEIFNLKKNIKPVTDKIKTLSVKKRQLATIVAKMMKLNEIDSLNPKSQDGKETRITQITTKRSKPTMAAMEAVLLELFKGNKEKLKKLQNKALTKCKAPVPSLRRTRYK